MSPRRRHSWAQRGRRLYDELVDTPAGQLLVALREVQLRDRALTLAGQAFIALVPLLIVVASWIGTTGGAEVAEWLVDRFELSGEAASAARALFSRPPDPTGGISVLGLVILLVSVNSFGRALQRTFEAAWRLPHRGPGRALRGALGTATLIASIAVVAIVTGFSRDLPGGPLLAVPVQLAVAIPCWWLLTRLLLNLRVGWRACLPGAVLGAVSQVLTGWAGSIYVPLLIERDAARYGVVGVAVALVSWLVVIAFVAVASAVAGAWASRMLVELRAVPPAGPR
ncbi:YihY/virulence factor BrkB family protein [Nocardioides panacisoli]|uniref:YhjD/YihY/BrkB family envelope integrity protein n=1 Tax=Nocardioides panacisoli TaxID=627624 RepID=UPI001C633262|nr:YhjD/YihY/BrkB family envelope integrity protein [Nocardioides panacisoli]QYJ04829.1 YihY/virulence factor BrkB family protein [Nocardioides panacisoli]